MSFEINYEVIVKNIIDKLSITSGDADNNNLSQGEKDFLESLGIDPENADSSVVNSYLAALAKFGANTPTEREQIITELKILTNRIKELAPNEDFSKLISKAYAADSLQKLFEIFGNEIKRLEEEQNKDEDVKTLERLCFINTNYSEFMSDEDYQNLIDILARHPEYNPSVNFLGENKKEITFTCNEKNYTFTINKYINTSAINDLTRDGSNAREFEEVLRRFATGELRWSELEQELAAFGFSREELLDSEVYDPYNDAYQITLTYNGQEYIFNCNIGVANDGNGVDEFGEVNEKYSISDIRAKGFNQNEIEKYFVKAFIKDGRVEFYTKNEHAWNEIGATSIDNLRGAIEKAEQKENAEKWVKEVVNELITDHELSAEQAQLLKDFMQTDEVKSRIEGLLGKSESDFKTSVKNIAEKFITENIKKTEEISNELSEEQKAIINQVCDDIAKVLGLTSEEKEVLKAQLLEEAQKPDFATSADFNDKVATMAMIIAKIIINANSASRTDNNEEVNVQELFNKYQQNHSVEILKQIMKYVDISITSHYEDDRNEDSLVYTVTVTYNGVSDEYKGFTEEQINELGIDGVTTSGGSKTLTASEKNEILLDICLEAQQNGIGDKKLTPQQAMLLLKRLSEADFYRKDYKNTKDFETKAREEAAKIGAEILQETDVTNSNSNNTKDIDFGSKDFLNFKNSVENYVNYNTNNQYTMRSYIQGDSFRFELSDKNGSSAGYLIINKDGTYENHLKADGYVNSTIEGILSNFLNSI